MKKFVYYVMFFCCFSIFAETITFNTPADWQNEKAFTVNENGTLTATLAGMTLSKKMITLDKKKQYFLNGTIKATKNSPKGGIYVGFRIYDEKERHLQMHFCQYVAGSDTEIVESTEPGDTYIIVKNASKWRIHPYMVIAWNTEIDKSDLPNRNIISATPKKIEFKDNNWIIHLDKPVNTILPAGTKIREHSRGGEFYIRTGSTAKDLIFRNQKINWLGGVAKVQALILALPAQKGTKLNLELMNFMLELK